MKKVPEGSYIVEGEIGIQFSKLQQGAISSVLNHRSRTVEKEVINFLSGWGLEERGKIKEVCKEEVM